MNDTPSKDKAKLKQDLKQALDSKKQKRTYDWLKPTQFKKGQTGNPNGRPRGKSMKTWLRERFQELTDEERIAILNKIDPVRAWAMAEGNPETKSDVNVKGTINLTDLYKRSSTTHQSDSEDQKPD